MNRRAFLTATAMAPGLGLVKPVTAAAELPKGRITRVRIYRPPNLNPHAVGIIPHFTGPIATAALVNCLSTFAGPVMLEYNFGGRTPEYVPESFDFRNGRMYPNARPGLGVTADVKQLTMIGELTQPGRRNVYRRPDGSLTHW